METQNNNENYNLKRHSSFLRCWNLEGVGEIKKIVFYSKGQILYQSSSSWLECEERRQDLTALKIQTPKRALKKNLNRTDNFYINEVAFSYSKEKGIVVYVNIESEGITFADEIESLWHETNNEKVLRTLIKINGIKGLIYEPYLNDEKELKYREIKTDYAVLFVKTRTERKEQGLKADKLNEEFKQLMNVDISTYDLEKILDRYTIEKKASD